MDFKSARVIVVDNDQEVLHFVEKEMASKFNLITAVSVESALKLIEIQQTDLLVMPVEGIGLDGVSFCSQMRQSSRYKNIPIIMVSNANNEQLRIRSFLAGADDFMAKPFSCQELELRIISKLRRTNNRATESELVACGNMAVHLAAGEITVNQKAIPLTTQEFNLLLHLIRDRNRMHTREEILKAVWKDCVVMKRTVDTHICSLRRKLFEFDHSIESVYRRGYIVRPRKNNGVFNSAQVPTL